MTNPICRRKFLAAAGASAGVAFLPSIVVPKLARADLRANAPAMRVLVLNLLGGIRSSAAFHASSLKKYNPYGLIAEAQGEFRLGRFLDDYCPSVGQNTPADASTYALPGAWNGLSLPRLRDVANKFSVIATWGPDRGDHILSRTKEPTGSGGGDEPGILTRIGAGLFDALKNDVDFPAFHIAPSANFGKAWSTFARFAPVTLAGPGSLPGGGDATIDRNEVETLTGHDWAKDDLDRGRIDQAIIAKRTRSARDLAEQLALHRRAAREIGATLAQPFVHVDSLDSQNAVLGKVQTNQGLVDLTNKMLRDAMLTTLQDAQNPIDHMAYSFAMDAAIAVRLLQLKSRAVCLEIGSFDYHSGEIDGRPLYSFLGRMWAALGWLLARIPDPEAPGKTLFDTTLVLTMSDFGRDPGSVATGYNGGGGSDHGADPSCFTLAHAVMGAGVKGGRLISKVSTDTYRADQADVTYGARNLLAMILWSLGLDHQNGEWGFEDVSDPIQKVFA